MCSRVARATCGPVRLVCAARARSTNARLGLCLSRGCVGFACWWRNGELLRCTACMFVPLPRNHTTKQVFRLTSLLAYRSRQTATLNCARVFSSGDELRHTWSSFGGHVYEHPHNLYGCDYCPAGQKRLEGLTRHTLPGRNVDSKDNLRLLCGVNFEARAAASSRCGKSVQTLFRVGDP